MSLLILVMKNTLNDVLCFSVTIECPKCREVFVNSNDQLTLEAVHSGYNERDLNYTWHLSEIVGSESSHSNGKTVCNFCFHYQL